MNTDLIFKCEWLPAIMEGAEKPTESLSVGAIELLREEYYNARYGRNTGIDIIQRSLEKVYGCNAEAAELYSRVNKTLYKRNEFPLSNRYIGGLVDLFTGPIIHEAESVIKLLPTWSFEGFFKNNASQLSVFNYWELQGYMALTGAQTATVAHVLVNTPKPELQHKIEAAQQKMQVFNPGTDKNFQRVATEIERMGNYADMPMNERIIEVTVERNDADIERIYERIKVCRVWQNEHL